jgi:hypothetical protein
MRHVPRLAAFLLVIGLVLPLLAADDKPADAKKDADKNPNTEHYVKAGEITCKIVAVYESKKSLRLQVPTLNEGAVRAYAQAEQQYLQALRQRNQGSAASALQNMARQEANMVTLGPKEVEVQTTDEVKVRLLNPPVAFDDKGKIKKYSAKELKELKGNDPKLPGYNGEFSDLQTGQIVKLTLVRKKGDPAPKPTGKKGKDAELELVKDELPPISVILVDNGNPMGK